MIIKRKLEKVLTGDEKKQIVLKFNKEKLLTKKEFIKEPNRSYYISERNPTELILKLE